jgi:aspartate/tyrosine/aromatic aminotransferase
MHGARLVQEVLRNAIVDGDWDDDGEEDVEAIIAEADGYVEDASTSEVAHNFSMPPTR